MNLHLRSICFCVSYYLDTFIYKTVTRTFVTQDLRCRQFSDKISTPVHINITYTGFKALLRQATTLLKDVMLTLKILLLQSIFSTNKYIMGFPHNI